MDNSPVREMALEEWVSSLPPTHRARLELARMQAKTQAIQRTVDQQALDEGLWFDAETASEAYLQQALRRLHAVIEA